MGELIFLDNYLLGRVAFAHEKDTLPIISDRVKGLFDGITNPDRTGIYLVSSNAGFQSSIQFWSNARQTGFGVAPPELFPWTLSNAPCGWLSREFQITGPNFTYPGRAGALVSALNQCREHLLAGRITVGWLIALDFAEKPEEDTAFAVLRLSTRSSDLCIQALALPFQADAPKENASTMLSRAFQSLASGEKQAPLSDGSSNFFLKVLG